MIEAAGGVLWRRTSNDKVKVLVVHRPRYDDWSLTKGKLEPGESARSAALREVEEETGLRCKAGDELAELRYKDRKGRSKRVRYWAMRPIDGEFVPNDEVDEVRWGPLEDVGDLLSYEHDAGVVDELGRRLLVGA